MTSPAGDEAGVWQVESSPQGMRVLACQPHPEDSRQVCFYLSQGYKLWRVEPRAGDLRQASLVASFHPVWWRSLTSDHRLSARLVRDGFHALAILDTGAMVAAVPGAIVTRAARDNEFRITHRITRGTRPLHITATPSGRLYWGEYFSNSERHEVHIYGSLDAGQHWDVAYTFPARSVRHVHNMIWDKFAQRLWILTGDEGAECRVLSASEDLSDIVPVLEGNQQARAVAAVPMRDGLYFATDTPLEQNYIYHLSRAGNLQRLTPIPSSSLSGCRVGDWVLFSTMAEPSSVNTQAAVSLYGANCADASSTPQFTELGQWAKDAWPMKYFQFGNVFLPDGENDSDWLAFTTTAVKTHDATTHFWRRTSRPEALPMHQAVTR